MDPTLLKDIHFFQKSAAAAPVFMVPGHIVAWIPFPNAAQELFRIIVGKLIVENIASHQDQIWILTVNSVYQFPLIFSVSAGMEV